MLPATLQYFMLHLQHSLLLPNIPCYSSSLPATPHHSLLLSNAPCYSPVLHAPSSTFPATPQHSLLLLITPCFILNTPASSTLPATP
ncbi:hypothetical protein Hamer_G012905 [Homarus americanus]|uniref:Uncharacterized protein n=1 Tax=Homarus americanus TaxID=6706 RepID=A0A8J5JZM9_HOMAM|nr:hypothetical protein Hamer_G012905 [Homarus americanus]